MIAEQRELVERYVSSFFHYIWLTCVGLYMYMHCLVDFGLMCACGCGCKMRVWLWNGSWLVERCVFSFHNVWLGFLIVTLD